MFWTEKIKDRTWFKNFKMSEQNIKICDIRSNVGSNVVIGRIVQKSGLNMFLSGKGQLFSIEFQDSSGEIRMVFFNDF